MQCPNGDGELISHATHGEQNLTITYSNCPVCHGYWMEAFAANFIKIPPGSSIPLADAGNPPNCPVCKHLLVRATGENIPESVRVFTCPNHHGYFFPTGQLEAFKRAQQTKLEYHKLWSLPIPSVASILLAGILLLVLTGGIFSGFLSQQNRQSTTTRASELVSSHYANANAKTHTVLISAQTLYDATLTVYIPRLNNFSELMPTKDARTHIVTVTKVPSGTYEYYFTIKTGNEEVQSQIYSFEMPQ